MSNVPPPAASRASFDARTNVWNWAAFAACGAIWGSTFLVISIGNDALAPVWAATLRLAAASLLLAAWTLLRGQRLPRGAALRAALGYGVAQFGVNLPLLYWGERVCSVGARRRHLRDAAAVQRAHRARLSHGAPDAGEARRSGGGVRGRRGPVLVDAARGIPPAGLGAILVGATAASLGPSC